MPRFWHGLIAWHPREVAQIGAALGRSFSHELISAVAGIPQQQIDEALTQLTSHELIFRRGTPPDAEYTFKHALVQDAAYSTLLKARRQQIHSKIATTLEENFLDIVTAQPALLAHHCTEAGLVEKAVGYWLKAGQLSLTRSTMTEAVAQLKKGLELLGGLPNGTRRQSVSLRAAGVGGWRRTAGCSTSCRYSQNQSCSERWSTAWPRWFGATQRAAGRRKRVGT